MFTILSLRGCTFCAKARKLLSELGYKYKTQYPNKARLLLRTGKTTYPQIYDGDQLIGGYDDLRFYLGLARWGGASQKPVCRTSILRGCSA